MLKDFHAARCSGQSASPTGRSANSATRLAAANHSGRAPIGDGPPQGIYIQVQSPPRPHRERRKNSADKTIRVLMLVTTIIFVSMLALTLVFVVVSGAQQLDDRDPNSGAGTVLGIMFGFACFAFFETMAYAVVMLIFWAVRNSMK